MPFAWAMEFQRGDEAGHQLGVGTVYTVVTVTTAFWVRIFPHGRRLMERRPST